MIHFNFTKPNEIDSEGSLKITLDNDASKFYENKQFPLRFTIKSLSGEVIWSTDLYPNWYSSFTKLSNTTIQIIDSCGNELFKWVWNPFIHGDFASQLFEIWSINNVGSNGIAIGVHDGMTGEWVRPVNKGLLKATLIEPSEKQFKNLEKFYKGKSWVKYEKLLITDDGKDVIFYEGIDSDGETNSISKKTIKKHLDESKITSIKMKSKSINDLIVESSVDGKVKWIHMDVEGMDGNLIMSIKDELLPELLVFENLHLDFHFYEEVCNHLKNKGYLITKSNWNTICIQQNKTK